MSGSLYIIATPIGNLADMTFRAIDILKSVDVIVCEDTRRTIKLLSHYEIKKPLLRYDEHTHQRMASKLMAQLEDGKTLALVSDAGTPAISDPGARLVEVAQSQGISVIPIPGASSVSAAVSASGFNSEGYVFLGFLPRKGGKARRILQESVGLGKTIVLFESPFRVEATLKLISELIPGGDVFVAREMTKIHEQYIKNKIEQLIDEAKKKIKGEYVIVIGPQDKKKLQKSEKD